MSSNPSWNWIGGLLLPAAVALGVTGSIAGCGKAAPAAGGGSTQPAGAKPVPVTTAEAKLLKVERSVHIVGELAPLERVTLSNRVTGTVLETKFDVGDQVKPSVFDGTREGKVPMLIIEAKRFRMGVIQGRQELNEVLARLGRTERVGPDDVIDEQHPILDWQSVKIEETAPYMKAQSEYETAKKKYEKAKPLYEQKLMREFEFTDYENAVQVATSSLRVAADEARALIAQAQGLEATIQIKQKDLDDSVIVAPGGMSGDKTPIKRYWVKERRVSAGEYLKEGTILFVLEADEPIKLRARVPERELARVAINDKIRFNVAAYGDRTFEGTVRVIEPTVDPTNRTFMVEARVDNPPGPDKGQRLLRSGQFVQGDILVESAAEARVLCVPVGSVTSFVGENKVFVVDPSPEAGKPARARQVSVNLLQQVTVPGPDNKPQSWIEVSFKDPKNVIKEGDRIVMDGVTKLVDKAPVTVATPGPAAAGSSEK